MQKVLILITVVSTMLAACSATREVRVERAEGAPAAPTNSAIFSQNATVPPAPGMVRATGEASGPGLPGEQVTPVRWFEGGQPTPTAAPIPTPAVTATPAPTPIPPRLITETIFGDDLGEAWTLSNSRWMTYSIQSERVHSGETALVFRPQEDFGSLFFTVRRGATAVFPYRQVMGVGFYLNAGDTELQLEDLALTLVGSNDYNYWVAGDDSVQSNRDPIFSETRLYFLGFNRSFPPNRWVYVELWLDDLVYDPPYEYVTGFYIKNDRGVFQKMYVDDVHLIILEEPLDE